MKAREPALRRRISDTYDNALAESTIGLFKTELINRAGRGGLATRSRSPPWNTSTGTTTATYTPARQTCHQPTSKTLHHPTDPCLTEATSQPN